MSRNAIKCFPLRSGSTEHPQYKWLHKVPRREKATTSLGNRSWCLTLLQGNLLRTVKGHPSWYREHLAPHREVSWHHFSFADVEFKNLIQRDPMICRRTRQNWKSVVLVCFSLMSSILGIIQMTAFGQKCLGELKTRIKVKDNLSDVSYWTSPKVILSIKLYSWPQGLHLKCILCEFLA